MNLFEKRKSICQSFENAKNIIKWEHGANEAEKLKILIRSDELDIDFEGEHVCS